MPLQKGKCHKLVFGGHSGGGITFVINQAIPCESKAKL